MRKEITLFTKTAPRPHKPRMTTSGLFTKILELSKEVIFLTSYLSQCSLLEIKEVNIRHEIRTDEKRT